MEPIKFTIDTILGEKAVEERSGDLVIEGYAADYDVDRVGDYFDPNSGLEAAAKAFIARGGPLLYNHDRNAQLGQITHAEQREKGLWVRGVIPKPAEGSPLSDVVAKIKRGMTRGMSVKGLWRPVRTALGRRLAIQDMVEISMTPVPVQPNAGVLQVAEKALDLDDLPSAAVLAWLDRQFDGLDALIERLPASE